MRRGVDVGGIGVATLTLLRHASPKAEYHKRYIGHTDLSIDVQLWEAKKAAEILRLSFDAVYSSDLMRCTQTLEHLGFDHFIPDIRLREVRFKQQFEGKNFRQIEQTEGFDPAFLHTRERWHSYICDEPYEDFRGRIVNFLEEIPHNKRILICSHGGTIGEICTILQPNHNYPPLHYLEHTILRVK